MTEIAEATGIPLTTLSDMSDADWRPKVFDRLEKLSVALDRIKRQPSKSNRKGRAAATA